MFTFFYNAVRVFACTLVVLTAIAAGIGRRNPPSPVLRLPRPALQIEIEEGRTIPAWNLNYRLRDPATGGLVHFAAPREQRLEHASCSPWRSLDDKSQLVALWASFTGRGGAALPTGSGIARYSIPDGEVLDLVPLQSPPTSPPCWYPGTEARVLYAAGDGWLYHYNFDRPSDGPVKDGGNQPRPLAWPDRPPGFEKLVFLQPTWPDDPRLQGRLIVAMCRLVGSGKSSRFGASKLWWLQLDRGGTRVEAAGRLTVSGEDDEAFEERRPRVTTTPDGGLLLSYRTGPRGGPMEQLRIVPIAFDPATQAPIALRTPSDDPAEGGPSIAPIPPADGRHVAYARGGGIR